MAISVKQLSDCLGSAYSTASFLDRLKIKYRPYICPFQDLVELCKDSRSIVDIGCGSGQFLFLLAKYTRASELAGIEISEKLVNNANELLGNQIDTSVRVETFDGTNLPAFISGFDTITLIDVFHHIPKTEQATFISNLCTLMKPGATLIFKDIDAGNPLVLMNKLHDTFFGGGSGNEISFLNAKRLLSATGFSIKSHSLNVMLWYPHYTIVCEKT